MGGAFNFFGNFLRGYTDARDKKNQQKLVKRQADMNTAMQWANIADTTKNDAIREMATKNMQDLIVNYEKEAGEKNGISSIMKIFGGGKKDQGSVLNKLAPALSKPAEYDTSGMTEEQAATMGTVDQPGVGAAAGAAQQSPEDFIKGEGLTPEQAGNKRVQNIASAVAPGRSVFTLGYAGGSRYSPTNEEIYAEQRQKQKEDLAMQQEANISNANAIADAAQKRTDEQRAKQKEILHQTQRYINAPQEMKDQMDMAVDQIPSWQPSEYDLLPSGSPFVEGSRIMQKNNMGVSQDITDTWKKNNPIAAGFFDAMKVSEKNIENAEMLAGAYQKELQGLEKQKLEAQIAESKAQGSYLKSRSTQELLRERNTTLALLKQSQSSALNTIKELNDQWNIELARLADIGVGDAEEEAKKMQKFKVNPDGSIEKLRQNWSSLEEYKDAYFARALGGVDYRRIAHRAATGIDPDLDSIYSLDNIDPELDRRAQNGDSLAERTMRSSSSSTSVVPTVPTPGIPQIGLGAQEEDDLASQILGE